MKVGKVNGMYNYGTQPQEFNPEPPKGAEDVNSKGEGLLLEEDEDSTIHSDGYDQWHEGETVEINRGGQANCSWYQRNMQGSYE